MKILIATNHSYMLYRFRKELIEELLKKSEVVLSMPFNGHEDDFINMRCKCIKTDVDRRGMNPFTDFKLLLHYFKILKNEKPDKLITYSVKPNIYASFAARVKKIQYYANIQGLGTAFQNKNTEKLISVMYKAALKNAKCVFFENKSNADFIISKHIIGTDKTKILNGAGINLQKYKFKDYPTDEVVRFLFVGRIMREKGVDELFEAAKMLKKEFASKVEIHIVGFFEDEYKEITDNLSKQGIIKFFGFQQDVLPFYEQSSCVVLPSYHEGMSNVLLEASASGRPVITTDIPGCREAVDNGASGFLVKSGSIDELYKAMKAFINLPIEKRAEMGKCAREKMEKYFDKRKVVNETLSTIFKD